MWSSSANAETLTDITAALTSDEASSGDLSADLAAMFSKHSVEAPCPFVHAVPSGLKVLNCEIDLASWHCMLLTAAMPHSPAKEITVHGCALTTAHVKSLLAALSKCKGSVHTLKLDYSTMLSPPNEEDGSTEQSPPSEPHIFVELLGSAPMLEYISFKGNELDDAFAAACADTFARHNYTVKALNLAENSFTDEGARSLLRAAG